MEEKELWKIQPEEVHGHFIDVALKYSSNKL